MAERLSPEAEAMLPEVSEAVLRLYLTDQLSREFGTQTPSQRDYSWAATAEKFPLFSKQVNVLREGLKGAEITRQKYSEPLMGILCLGLADVEDGVARVLLEDVLILRLAKSPGNLDHNLDPLAEFDAMAGELDTIFPGSLTSLKPDAVVKAILAGGLNLTAQTPSDATSQIKTY